MDQLDAYEAGIVKFKKIIRRAEIVVEVAVKGQDPEPVVTVQKGWRFYV